MYLGAVKVRDVGPFVKSAAFAALPPLPLSRHPCCLRDTVINNHSLCMSNMKENAIRENNV